MALRLLADVTGWLVVSLTELEVTVGTGRKWKFSSEQAVPEARARPSSVQVQGSAGRVDPELKREGWVGDKDLAVNSPWKETETRDMKWSREGVQRRQPRTELQLLRDGQRETLTGESREHLQEGVVRRTGCQREAK